MQRQFIAANGTVFWQCLETGIMKDEQRSEGPRPDQTNGEKDNKAKTTLNLDTGEVEELKPQEEQSAMDFAPGSDGGSAGDGGAA